MNASHVLIRGLVFPYGEKAPFVPSGESILGALEYSEDADQLKCHECGTWVRGLGMHIKLHGLKREEYNQIHGLHKRRGLCTPAYSEARVSHANKHHPLSLVKRRYVRKRGQKMGKRNMEGANEHAKCAAQILFRIQTVAAKSRHTPTLAELEEVGIWESILVARFGSHARAIELAGLEPNVAHRKAPSPVPRGFPSEKEMETRMPWPQDYFGVYPFKKHA